VVRGTDTRITGGQAEFIMVVGNTADLAQIYRAQPKQPTLSFWVKPGERIYHPLEFRNVGHATWRRDGWGVTNLARVVTEGTAAVASTGSLSVQSTPTITKSAARRDYTSAILDVVAPNTPGLYRETFGLVGPNGPISGSTVTVEVNVSDDPKPPFDAEPIVRVGVYAPAKPVVVTANGPYEIRQADSGELIAAGAADAEATVTYNDTVQTYALTSNDTISNLSGAIRFVPAGDQTIIEIKSFSNKREVAVDGQTTTVNDNKFRGTIEVRYASATKKLWVINELPLEQYLAGLAETTNRAPLEFIKTLVTAARSYALYHRLRATKHADENYHINSTTDQLYRGYNYELRHPNIGVGANQTRGIVATHPSMVNDKNTIGAIVAAYSSCTDGRTRSYEERWGGTPGLFPYLASVPDPDGLCTSQRWLQGLDGNHMVGMSATGALRSVANQNLTFDAVLRYYYTGISLLRAY
jgi:peptidoglycan hydrolase-like amidase